MSSLFRCPVCKWPKSRVVDSRIKEGEIVYRRRDCLNPAGTHRWSTAEVECAWPHGGNRDQPHGKGGKFSSRRKGKSKDLLDDLA